MITLNISPQFLEIQKNMTLLSDNRSPVNFRQKNAVIELEKHEHE